MRIYPCYSEQAIEITSAKQLETWSRWREAQKRETEWNLQDLNRMLEIDKSPKFAQEP